MSKYSFHAPGNTAPLWVFTVSPFYQARNTSSNRYAYKSVCLLPLFRSQSCIRWETIMRRIAYFSIMGSNKFSNLRNPPPQHSNSLLINSTPSLPHNVVSNVLHTTLLWKQLSTILHLFLCKFYRHAILTITLSNGRSCPISRP